MAREQNVVVVADIPTPYCYFIIGGCFCHHRRHPTLVNPYYEIFWTQEVKQQKLEEEKLIQEIERKRTEILQIKAKFLKHANNCEIFKRDQQLRFLAQKNAAARVKHAEIKRQKAASSCYNTARVAPRVSSHPYKLVQDQQRQKVYAQL